MEKKMHNENDVFYEDSLLYMGLAVAKGSEKVLRRISFSPLQSYRIAPVHL